MTVTEYVKTGTVKPGSMRITRHATPPPPAEENWPRAEKFGGKPTPVFIFRSVASASWSVDRGFSVQPAELAAYLIRGGHARAAHQDQMPNAE